MPKALSSEMQSRFDFRPGVLGRADCELAARNAALADKLGQLAVSSADNPGLARRLEELAGDYAGQCQQILHRATVSAVAQVQGNQAGKLDVRFTQTVKDGNPPVTVTQVSAYAVNSPRRGNKATAGIEISASFSAKAGLSGLRQNAEVHARATVITPPSEIKVELANGWSGLLQRAISLFGVQTGAVTKVFTPEGRGLAVANETSRLVNEATARSASQIPDETVQRVVSDPRFEEEFHNDYGHAAVAASEQWEAVAAEVARDYGDGGRYEGMSILEASIASLQTTGHWRD